MNHMALSLFSFSYSAPAVTEEQEQTELEALTPAERIELHADLYPNDESISSALAQFALEETKENVSRAVAMLKEAALQLPEKETAAYQQALQQSPELVERESDPVAFLRCERWDVWAAAKRLVTYWKVRKSLFGDRAFVLPMTLDGAIANDRDTLAKAVILILPPDKFGRPILFFDRTRIKKNGDVEAKSVARCMFYMRSVIGESLMAQKMGCVNIVNGRSAELFVHYTRPLTRDLAAILHTVPARVATIHLACQTHHDVARKVLLPVIKFIFGKKWRQRLVIHSGPDFLVLRELAEFGIPEENLSGCFDERRELRSARLEQWLQERQALEQSRNGR